MAKLFFKVESDLQKVVDLRNEIQRLETQLKSFGKSTPTAQIRQTESQLASARQQFQSLGSSAAMAAAQMGTNFKQQILAASQSVANLSNRIIDQKAVVHEMQNNVRSLGEAYRTALKGGGTGEAELTQLTKAKEALAAEKDALFQLNLEKSRAVVTTQELKAEYEAFNEEADDSTDTLGKMNEKFREIAMTLGIGIGVKALIDGIKQLGQAVIETRGQFQQMETSLEVLLGSREKADALMAQIKEFAKVSPLDLKSTVAATQMMLGFNIEAEKVPKFLRAIGDVAMGDAGRFNSLTLAFSQMSASGKLMGQDLNQMINAGFNPLQAIAAKTGKSIADLKEEMSKGAISAEMVQQAFIDATSAGGKFYQMSERASKTINGQLSMLQDAMDAAFNEMGQASEGFILDSIQGVTSLIQNWKEVGEVMLALVATYGVYKTVVMTTAAVQGSAYAAELAALTELTTAKAAEGGTTAAMANADLDAAVKSGVLTAEKAKQIATLRAEVAAKVASAQASAKAAATEVASANTSLVAAKQRLAQAELSLNVERQRALAVRNSTNAELIATRQAAVRTAAEQHQAAMMEVKIAEEQVYIATKRQETAQTALNTVTTEAETAAKMINSGANVANTGTSNLLATAKTKLIAVTKRLTAAMMANPWALAAAGVAALGYGIYKLITYETDAEKAQKALNQVHDEFNKKTAAEQVQIDRLFTKLKNAKEGTKAYQKAKDDIISKYGSYLNGLDKEISSLKNVEAAYKAVASAARDAAKARAIEAATTTAADTYAGVEANARQQIMDTLKEHYGDQKDATGAYLWELRYNEVIGSKYFDPTSTTTLKESWLRQFDETHAAPGGPGPSTTYTTNAIESALKKQAEGKKNFEKSLEDIERLYGEAPKKEGEKAEEEAIHNKEWHKNEISKIDAQIDAMADAKIDAGEADELRKKRDKLQAEMDKRWGNKTTSTSTSSTSSSDTDSPAKRAMETKKAEQEYADTVSEFIRDMQQEISDANIDAMSESTDKEIAQIRADKQKKLNALEKEIEDLAKAQMQKDKEVWLNADKNRKEEDYIPTKTKEQYVAEIKADKTTGSLYTTRYNQIVAEANKAEDKIVDNAKQSWNEYLKEYGTYEQKRQAITDLYMEKYNKATNAGDKMSILAQMKKELSELDVEANKKTAAISRLFEDMSKKSVEEMREIATKGQKALDFLIKGEWNDAQGIQFGMTKDTFDVLKASPEELDKIRKAIESITNAADDSEGAFKKMANGLKDLFEKGANAKDIEKALQTISSELSKVTNAAGFLADTFAGLGETFGNDTLKEIGEGINVAIDALDSAMKGAEAAANLGLGAIGAAAGAALGLVSSLVQSLSKIHDQKHEEKIEDLQDQIDEVRKSYDNLNDEIDKLYSKSASAKIKEQNALLEKQNKLIREQMEEEEAKKNTDEDRLKDWNDQLEENEKQIKKNKEAAIDAVFGSDLQSAIENFANAYADAWSNGTSKIKAAKDIVRDMMRNMVIESIKASIETSKAMEQIRNAMLEFYGDNIFSIAEQDEMMRMAEDLQAELDRDYAWADNLLKDTYSQDGSSRGFQAMSQDTGDELNGRFTAMVELQTLALDEQRKQTALLTQMVESGGMSFADAVKAYMGSNAMDIGKVMAEGFVNANSSATTIVQNNALGEQMADMNNRLGNLEVMTADFFLNMQTTVENNAKMTKNSNQMVELSRETNNLLKNL